MKKQCNIIRDLMPLYLDEVVSEESKKLVEDHLPSCLECQHYLEDLKLELDVEKESDVNVIKKLTRMKNLRFIRNFLIVLNSLLILGIIGAYLVGNVPITLTDGEVKALGDAGAITGLEYRHSFEGKVEAETRTIMENEEEVELIFISFKTNLYNIFQSLMQNEESRSTYGLDIPIDTTKLTDHFRVINTNNYSLNEFRGADLETLNNYLKHSEILFSNETITTSLKCTIDDKKIDNYRLTYYYPSLQIVASQGEDFIMNYFPDAMVYLDFAELKYSSIKSSDVISIIKAYYSHNNGECQES